MFGTDSHDEASQQSDPETGLRHLSALRAQSYTAHAQLVLEVWEHVTCRMFDNQTDHLAQRAAFADIATILGISRASVKAMDDTVMSIGRIAGLRDAFTSGELDYAKVRTIVSVVSLGASGETCTLMAKRILSDARHLTPGPCAPPSGPPGWTPTPEKPKKHAPACANTNAKSMSVKAPTRCAGSRHA